MNCLGIYIDGYSQRTLFNPDLAIKQGHTIITNHTYIKDPEVMRRTVETKLQLAFPHVQVRFFDQDSELEIEGQPERDYSLIICQEAPIYSGRMH